MPRAGLSATVIVEAAASLADEVGLEQLTLAAVAKHFGVALPSLYKHVAGADELRQLLATLATQRLTAALADAAVGRARRDALVDVASAYRDFARRHPGQYAATVRAPDAADSEHAQAAGAAARMVLAVLDGYGLAGDDAIDATRALRSALHGFVALEAAGGFGMPQDVDRSFDRMVDAFDGALVRWPTQTR